MPSHPPPLFLGSFNYLRRLLLVLADRYRFFLGLGRHMKVESSGS
jgi:hypothetical protein